MVNLVIRANSADGVFNEPPPNQEFLFHDAFASGDRTHTDNGVVWGGGNTRNVAIVADPGNHSGFAMRFRYSDPGAGSSFAEQNFQLNNFYPELWQKWRLVIPANFNHPSDGNDNNKLIRLWSDDYTNFDVKFGCSLIPTVGATGESRLLPEYGTNTDPIGPNGGASAHIANMVMEQDFGDEVEYVFHFKVDTAGTPGGDSAATGGNGVFQVWKNGTRIVNMTQIKNRPTTGTNAFLRGYLFGADNTDYANGTEMTEFFLREFWLAETNVFGVV